MSPQPNIYTVTVFTQSLYSHSHSIHTVTILPQKNRQPNSHFESMHVTVPLPVLLSRYSRLFIVDEITELF